MLIACWSPKGGSGTTVLSAALALVLAGAEFGDGALLVDLAGDVPAALGLPEPTGPGAGDWLAAEADVADDALERLEVAATPQLQVLPAGSAAGLGSATRRGGALASALADDPRPVVVDCGRAAVGAALVVAAAAPVSLLVLRPCYLAVRRATAATVTPSGVVLVAEPERSLSRRDIEEVLGAPVEVAIPVEPSVARAVDAGLLARRLPRPLAAAAHELTDSLPVSRSDLGTRRRGPDAAARPVSQLRRTPRR